MITQLIAKYYDLLRKENTVCSRKDYWIFVLITFGINIILIFVSAILESFGFSSIFQLPLFLISAFMCICQIILVIKRFHDINLSGYWILVLNILPILCLFLNWKKHQSERILFSINNFHFLHSFIIYAFCHI